MERILCASDSSAIVPQQKKNKGMGDLTYDLST